MRAAHHLANEPLHIKTESRGVLGEALVIECILVLKQKVVHFPKTVLRTGRFGGFGRVFRVRVHVSERKIAISEAQAITQAFLNGFDNGMCLTAIRAFVVAILNEHDRRINWPLDMVAPGGWQGEFRT